MAPLETKKITEPALLTPHTEYMRVALSLAQRGLGNTWPNPAVGCVIVKNDLVVGRGWTQPGGRPHAEREALDRAGESARGADAYVTLEPCCHQGQTPPCADALINAGVKQVFVAVMDPDYRVSGAGISKLEAAGIDVTAGLLREEATKANSGFLNRVKTGRPSFTLKTATTADGKIATKSLQSQWITGDEARRYGHLLRATNDAVLVGSGTVLEDDPELTCRLPGLSSDRRPRIVIDGRLRVPLTSKLVSSADQTPLWIVTLTTHSADQTSPYEAHGVTVIRVKADEAGHPRIPEWSLELGRRGITRILVEGGSTLAGGLLAANLIDRITWFRSPKVMGDDGIAAISALGAHRIEDLLQFQTILSKPIGQDRLDILERTR